jgi:aryl-alcohol dehydrogenase-like predicted oxidoreductase
MGLGCLPLGGAYGPAEPAESARLVGHALDAGVALLDACDLPGRTDVQRVVARAVAGRRGDALLALHHRPAPGDGPAGNPVAACEAALRRLGVDQLDLWYLHPDGGEVPVEERVGPLAELVRAGKLRHVGLSGVSGEELLRAHTEHPITALAVEYSLWHREPERELLPLARKLGVGVVAARPLGRGLLTGRIDPAALLAAAPGDPAVATVPTPPSLPPRGPESGGPEPGGPRRAAGPRAGAARGGGPVGRGGRRPRGAGTPWETGDSTPLGAAQLHALGPRLARLSEIAAGLQLGVGRLALAWLAAQGEDVTAVPGTRDRVHLEMNLSSLGVRLGPETFEAIGGLFPPPPVPSPTPSSASSGSAGSPK